MLKAAAMYNKFRKYFHMSHSINLYPPIASSVEVRHDDNGEDGDVYIEDESDMEEEKRFAIHPEKIPPANMLNSSLTLLTADSTTTSEAASD